MAWPENMMQAGQILPRFPFLFLGMQGGGPTTAGPIVPVVIESPKLVQLFFVSPPPPPPPPPPPMAPAPAVAAPAAPAPARVARTVFGWTRDKFTPMKLRKAAPQASP